jgi:hypothetical protein
MSNTFQKNEKFLNWENVLSDMLSLPPSVPKIFGLSGLGPRHNTDMWCGTESANANRRFPLIITKDDRKEITRYNQLDTRLYEELTQCDVYQFPNRSLFTLS